MKAVNITAYTEDESQIKAIEAVIKAFKIKYKISKAQVEDNQNYDPEFVAKIERGRNDYKNDKGISISLEELKGYANNPDA